MSAIGQTVDHTAAQPSGQPAALLPRMQAPPPQQPSSSLALPASRPPPPNSNGPNPSRPPVPPPIASSTPHAAPGASTASYSAGPSAGHATPGRGSIQPSAGGGSGGGASAQHRPTYNPTSLSSHSRAKATDLIGRNSLLTKVAAVSKNHKVKVEDDASLYMMSAIEDTLRGLLARTLAAQVHRTSSSHLRVPPVRPSVASGVKKEEKDVKDEKRDKGKDEKDLRPMWSHTITSDPNAVLELLSRQARDAEQEFRKARMDRLARDAELQKARERANALALAHGGVVGGVGSGGGGGGGSSGGSSPLPPGTPASTSAGHSAPSSPPHSITSTPAPSTPKPPTFGALKETPSGSSSSSKKKNTAKKPGSRDLSAEVQHKMTNATAMRSVGMGKKYGWMMGNAPAVSSPLAGKKRKAGAGPSALGGSSTVPGEEGKTGKGKGKSTKGNGEAGPGEGGKAEGEGRPRKKQRPVAVPVRRLIPVDPVVPPHATGAPSNPSASTANTSSPTEPTRIPDDRALTFVDLAFALEHGGLGAAGGQGAGSVSGEALQRVWGRPGGAWGEGWEVIKK